MVSTEERGTFDRIASLAGWDVAAHYGCGFDGDSNPIDHDGIFFDERDWTSYGYASCVEFYRDPEDNGVLVVQRGTIHRPDDDKMESCWDCIGMAKDDPARSIVAAQISAVRSYCGYEPDGTSYPSCKSFRTDDWQEWRIWRSVAGWLSFLSS